MELTETGPPGRCKRAFDEPVEDAPCYTFYHSSDPGKFDYDSCCSCPYHEFQSWQPKEEAGWQPKEEPDYTPGVAIHLQEERKNEEEKVTDHCTIYLDEGCDCDICKSGEAEFNDMVSK